MKKIVLLIIAILTLQIGFSQTLTYSESQTILSDNSLACELTSGVIENTTFYRNFDLDDFNITSDYDITSVDFGIEKIINAPAGGYPVKVQIYSTNGNFPNGNLSLMNEVTVNLQDQALTIVNVPITATIPANEDFVIAIDVPSSSSVGDGTNNITFQIGSNDLGETLNTVRHHSYFSSTVCPGHDNIETFLENGWDDIHIVMNVNGSGSTASTGDLDLVSFNYYPNPVKERLNMSADEEISSVEVYNILGQQVKSMKPSQLNASLDLTTLASGTYMIKARVNDRVGSFKVVKE